MRDHSLRSIDLFNAFTWISTHLPIRVEGKVTTSNHGLRQVLRIVYDGYPGQNVSIPNKVLCHCSAVTPRDPIPADPGCFQMRRCDSENVFLPLAGGEALPRVRRVSRR